MIKNNVIKYIIMYKFIILVLIIIKVFIHNFKFYQNYFNLLLEIKFFNDIFLLVLKKFIVSLENIHKSET